MKQIGISTFVARRVFVCMLAASALAAVIPKSASAQTEPLIGRWTLNVAKSSYSPGPAPRSAVVVITASGPGLSAALDSVDAQGASSHAVYPLICDGASHPVTGDPDMDALSCQRPDPYTFGFTNTKAGRTVSTEVLAISGDGRTVIDNIRGVNAAGQRIVTATFWEKQ